MLDEVFRVHREGPADRLTDDPAPSTGEGGRLSRPAAHLALAAVSGGLVGALFLVVVLLVSGWGLQPLAAAAVATLLPVATAAASWLGARLPTRSSVAGGAGALAVGLAGLGLMPGPSVPLAGLWLVVCGAGLGLALPALIDATAHGGAHGDDDGAHHARAASLSTASRHLGLTAALLVVPFVLSADLADAGERAVLRSTAQVVDAELPLTAKFPLAVDLVGVVTESTEAGELPDLRPAFEGVEGDPEVLDDLREELDTSVELAATAGFSPALLITALFALAAVPLALLVGRPDPDDSVSRGLSFAVLFGVVLAGIGVGLSATAERPAEALAPTEPCAEVEPREGTSIDDRVQRVVVTAFSEAGCELGESPEEVLLTVLPENGQPRLDVDEDRLDAVLKQGLLSGLETEEADGLPPFVADVLRELVETLRVRELVERVPSLPI